VKIFLLCVNLWFRFWSKYMRIASFIKRAVPFVIALLLGVGAAWFLRENYVPDATSVPVVKEPARVYPPAVSDGAGSRGPNDTGTSFGETAGAAKPACSGTCALTILSKPKANYTDEARQKNIQGNVNLRITFLASGQIGGISPISGLPSGLTEQAIAAAREIKFTPATKDGTPYTKQMTVQYSFTIY
jgi:TonB family protein